jgi:hypothetical protein
MGYESKLYIIDKRTKDYKDLDSGKAYARTIASYDLEKCPGIEEPFQNESECYICLDNGEDDGERRVYTDKYHAPLREASFEEVLETINKLCNRGGVTGAQYRQILFPLATLLRSLRRNKNKYDELAVIHYGY